MPPEDAGVRMVMLFDYLFLSGADSPCQCMDENLADGGKVQKDVQKQADRQAAPTAGTAYRKRWQTQLPLASSVVLVQPPPAWAAIDSIHAAFTDILFGSAFWPLTASGLLLLTAHAMWRRRQAQRQAMRLEETLSDTQAQLDRCELLLLAEPQVMLLWDQTAHNLENTTEHDTSGAAEQAQADDMQPGSTPAEAAASPSPVHATPHALRHLPPTQVFTHPQVIGSLLPAGQDPADFAGWLEEPSVAELKAQLDALFAEGSVFNVSLRTTAGELIEADGRITGRMVMLRFRPLHGERLEALSREHDQRQLKEQAQRLTRLLASAPVPVWITDDDGRLQWANEAWLALLGAESLEAAKVEGLSLVGDAEMAAATPLESHGDWKRQLAVAVIDNKRRHFEIYERAFDRGIVHWAREVSDRVAVEEELQRQQAAQGRIFNQLSTALAIFDAERRLVFCNSAYVQLWQLDEEWLARKPREEDILNRLFDSGRLAITEDFPQWRQRWLDIYHEQKPRREQWQLAGGQVVQVVAEPQPGEGIICMFEDITEQTRLEARYREALQVQEETLDNLHEAVAVFGTDGRLRLFNRTFAALWGLDDARLRVRPHVDDIIAECREQVKDARFWDEVKFGITDPGEERAPWRSRVVRSSGQVLDCLLVPLPDGNTLITWYDVTDAVRAEQALRERAEALEESDRVKAAFLDSISYDLRTPLTTINGYSEMLQQGYAGPLTEQQQRYLRNVREASGELLEKIDTILDLAAIDAGKMSLDIETFEVLPMLEELAISIAGRLEQRDMALEIEVAEDVQAIEGDRARIMQALRHLLLNAIGFGHPGQVVRMGARRDAQGSVLFWVADSGPGMDAEMMQRAFERFFARPTPEGHRGPGLGLPLVKELMKLHGGDVDLHSQEGRGTTVICRLPQRQLMEQSA